MLGPILFAACLVVPGPTSWTQEKSATSAVETVSEAEAVRLLSALSKKTNDLKSFVARYRAQLGEQDLVITLTFEAPDRAKLAWHAPGMNLDTWQIDGRQSFRGDVGGGPTKGEVDWAEILSLGAEFDDAFRTAFPASAAERQGIGAGPVFALDMVADPERPDGRALNCQLGWDQTRGVLLTWLSDPKVWNGARREGDRMVREGPAGSTLTLSLESGFFETIQGKSPLRLEELRIDEDLPASTFTIPPAAEGARDISAEITAQQTHQVTVMERLRLYRIAARAVDGSGIEDVSWKNKVQSVFEALHTVVQKRASTEWIANSEAKIDEFLQRWGPEYQRARQDPAARQELEIAAAKWRVGLQESLQNSAESYLELVKVPRGLDLDASVTTAITAVETQAARAVHERQISVPLLARFDDGLRMAIDGK